MSAQKEVQARLAAPDIAAMKGKTPIVCLTAYTAPMAELLDPVCDGQVLVIDDMLGLFDWTPKFVRRYADLRTEIDKAVREYAADVRARRFPGEAETYQLIRRA